ncbi:hypothetical protein GYA19_03660 [Candidatus Beckwithbacteria bacterium]|nr:hypothetical protein [Candidatus Beckwithbacteria bacterium]
MKTAQRLFSFVAIVITVLVGMAVVAQPTYAMFQDATLDLEDSRPEQSGTHTFTFTVPTGGTFDDFIFDYCQEQSGGSCTTPTNMDADAGTLGSLTGLTYANWAEDASSDNNTYAMEHNGAGEVVADNTTIVIEIDSVKNPLIAGCNANGVNSSASTCYVQVTGRNSVGSTLDTAILSFTVVDDISVTARVDPTFTFVIEGVPTSTTTEAGAITTSIGTDYNTLPFGNLRVGTEKFGAHKLTVTTNVDGGYTVSIRMATPMTGVYSTNNIDPFARAGVSWSNPLAWQIPQGTNANVNTGWIGAHTTDDNVEESTTGAANGPYNGAAKFGPVNSSENIVMRSATSDNGTTFVYVTYAIEVNSAQPADTYTGVLLYNALPTY